MNNNLDKILGVLVLYKCKLEESETFISISKALKSNNQKLDLFVYDNSPEYYYDKKAIKEYPGTITYVHDKSNPGICKPYNLGLEKSVQNNKKWLLLLDQDTELTEDYLVKLSQVVQISNNYASIVPVIYSNGNIVSPTRYDFIGRMKAISFEDSGGIVNNITAINSGACVNVNFLSEIGGFNELFPLDMLDHWLNSEIEKHGENIFVLDIKLQHNLSVSDYSTLTVDRFIKILEAENVFCLRYNKKIIIYKLRLVLRMFKLLLSGNIRYSFKCFHYL
jgi:GT2 family glycosyltransferase